MSKDVAFRFAAKLQILGQENLGGGGGSAVHIEPPINAIRVKMVQNKL